MWWGRARLSGGKGEEGRRGKNQSKHHSCSSRVRPSWPFLLFGLGRYATSCGTEAAKSLPCSALSERSLKPGNFPSDQERKAAPCQCRSEEGYIDAASASCSHLVGPDEAHKHREEHRGWSRLGTLSKVVHHIVEGFLELRGRTVPEWKQCL